MTQRNTNVTAWMVGLFGIILVVGLFVWLPNQFPEPVVPMTPNISVPTAAEIASLVVIPDNSENRINIRGSNFDDLLEGVYPDEVDELIRDCASDLRHEFFDESESDVERVIEADLGEDITDVEILDYNYDDDFEFFIIDLGIHDEDDREIEFFSRLEVEYREVFGNQDVFTVEVEAESLCADWDDQDDIFDELQVDYTVV